MCGLYHLVFRQQGFKLFKHSFLAVGVKMTCYLVGRAADLVNSRLLVISANGAKMDVILLFSAFIIVPPLRYALVSVANSQRAL